MRWLIGAAIAVAGFTCLWYAGELVAIGVAAVLIGDRLMDEAKL